MKTLSVFLSLILVLAVPSYGGIYLQNDSNTDDYIELTENSSTRVTTNFSACVWFNRNTTWNSSSSPDEYLLDNGRTDTSSGNWVVFWASSDSGKLRLPGSYGGNIQTTTNSWTAGEWYQVCFTYASRSSVKAYVNGVLETSGSTDSISGYDNSFRLGADCSGNDLGFEGKQSEFVFWNIVLSDDEIAQLYSSRIKRIPLQIKPNNIIMYLPLDDFADGTPLNTDVDGYKDLSGNGNHGQGVDADGDSYNVAETVLSYP